MTLASARPSGRFPYRRMSSTMRRRSPSPQSNRIAVLETSSQERRRRRETDFQHGEASHLGEDPGGDQVGAALTNEGRDTDVMVGVVAVEECRDRGGIENDHRRDFARRPQWRSSMSSSSRAENVPDEPAPIERGSGTSSSSNERRSASRRSSAAGTPVLIALAFNARSRSSGRYTVVFRMPHARYHPCGPARLGRRVGFGQSINATLSLLARCWPSRRPA